jgi:prolyl oligopeptidase
VYFGKEIVDPYRWLENLKDPEVTNWLNSQNEYTRSVLDKLPSRNSIFERMRQLDRLSPSPVKSISVDDTGKYYFIRDDADGVARGYVRDPMTGVERKVVDPTQLLVTSLQQITLISISPSPDGRYVAFVVRDSGEPKLYIAETASGELIGNPVIGILGFTGLDWDPDSKSIYIVKLPKGRGKDSSDSFLNSSAYRHFVGTSGSQDQLILRQGRNPSLTLRETSWPFVFPIPDKNYLAVWIEDGSRSGHALYVAEREKVLAGAGTWRMIADFDDGATHAVFHGHEAFLTRPRKSDGKPQIVRADVRNADLARSTEVVVPDEGLISDVQAASDALYVTVNAGVTNHFYRIAYEGRAKLLATPVSGNPEALVVTSNKPGGLFRISSWTEPAAMFEYSPVRGWKRSSIQPPSALGKSLDLVSEDVLDNGLDGVKIPLTIIHRRNLKRDGSNPTYLIGYGSYGFTIDPGFDNVFVPWFEAGGVLAYAHVRGGGELGEAWHMAGSKDKKPNTWSDFIACAQYLIDQKFTSPAKLAGGGTSAGGILIGRAITERPGLFRAALISVGTTDMLRAEYQMNGPANVVEFGTTKDKTGFDQLLEMSAYHHVANGKHYPAVLLTTGLRDPNVDVWQPAKMTAMLQSVADKDHPVLLRIDPNAGHDQFGSTRAEMQSWRADQIAFLMWQLGVSQSNPN